MSCFLGSKCCFNVFNHIDNCISNSLDSLRCFMQFSHHVVNSRYASPRKTTLLTILSRSLAVQPKTMLMTIVYPFIPMSFRSFSAFEIQKQGEVSKTPIIFMSCSSIQQHLASFYLKLEMFPEFFFAMNSQIVLLYFVKVRNRK